MPENPYNLSSSLANMDTMKGIIFPFEPRVWRGGIRVNYQKTPPIGGAGTFNDYSHTDNETFEAQFEWHRMLLAFGPKSKNKSMDEAADTIDRHMAFLASCTVPGERTPGQIGGDPPLLYLDVPGLLSVYCRIENLQWEVPRRSENDHRTMIYTAKVNFFEEPQYRHTSEYLLEHGYMRG
jgi:hypothetical protein